MGKRAKRQNALHRQKRRMEEIPLYPHELLRFSPLKSLANSSGFTKHPPVPVPTLRYRHGVRISGSEVIKPSEGREAHALLSAPGPARSRRPQVSSSSVLPQPHSALYSGGLRRGSEVPLCIRSGTGARDGSAVSEESVGLIID